MSENAGKEKDMALKHSNKGEETMRLVVIVMMLSIVISGCAPIDPRIAEQVRLFQAEARYVLEHETPLGPFYVDSYPAQSILLDHQPAFRLDPTAAWTVSFGRGGPPIGYNMVWMNEQGTVRLLYYAETHAPEGGWHEVGKKGMLTLSAEEIGTFIEYVNASPLLDMPKAYRAAWYDGDHWAVTIQQGVHHKTLYFHNHFPEAIIEFANTLDQILIRHGLFEIAWETISWEEANRYEKTLWE